MLPVAMGGALAGVRVLSLEQAVALPFATRHLAQLGADVIRVQSYERARPIDQSSIELVRSKRQLGLNLAADGAPDAFLRLAAACDVVAHNFTPRVVRKFGIDYDHVREVNPDVIYLSLTGFGTTGPWGERPLFGPGAEAVSGHNLLIGDPDGWPGRPGTGVYADDTCGMYALLAILAALDERARTGAGQHIDISLYETMVAHLGPVLAECGRGAGANRVSNQDARYALHGVFDASGTDRHVAIAATSEQLSALTTALEITSADEPTVAAALRQQEAGAAVERLQAVGVAASIVADARDLTTDEQLWRRGFFELRESAPGTIAPHQSAAWGGLPATRVEDPHLVGADNEDVLTDVGRFTREEIEALERTGAIGRASGRIGSRGVGDAPTRIFRGELTRVDGSLPDWSALASLSPDRSGTDKIASAVPTAAGNSKQARRRRAIDLSQSIAGAYATRLLADLGWDIVKVEPREGDALRGMPSRWDGSAGAAFAALNAGKRSVTVSPADIDRLVERADVVIGDFRAEQMEAFGLDSDAYRRLRPRQSVVSVTPFGLTGPKSGWAATELTVQAASGLMFLTGEADQPPQQLAPYQSELTGGVMAASAALASLQAAGPSPVRIDIALQEAMATHTFQATGPFVYYGEVARREQRIKAGLRMVPTSDGYVYCAPGAVASMRMDGIAELLQEPRLAEERFQTAEGRMTHWDEFLELFVPPFREKTAQEWFEAAESLHMTFALVQRVEDLFACPQLESRQFLRTVTTEEGEDLSIPLLPFITSREASTRPVAVPGAGGHTREVLEEWLGAGGER